MSASLEFTKLSKFYLSEGQLKYFYYCLCRLGFQDEVIQTLFLERMYESVCFEFRNHKSESVDAKTGWVDYYPFNERDFVGIVYDKIVSEVRFKKSNSFQGEIFDAPILSFIKKELNLSYVSATDIANFVYCPANYCIQKSFFNLPLSKEAKNGTEFHAMSRLADYTGSGKDKYRINEIVNGNALCNEYNQFFFDDIRASKINYIGHGENVKKYFKSRSGKFVGQPDYIFTNARGVKFIVEEKFTLVKDGKQVIKDNHKYQLSSYMLGLNEIAADYGYLVYWLYKYEEGVKKIKECIVYQIQRDSINSDEINNIYSEIMSMNNGSVVPFVKELISSSKCVNCVIRVICGHKTGRLSELSLPYDSSYYGLLR